MTRTDLLNHLIKKHGLKSYLEIGLQDASQNFDKIECERKVSVDPDPNAKATYCMTSDIFFKTTSYGLIEITTKDSDIKPEYIDNRFNLIFIDGLHTAEQVKKDFENALEILSPNGFIVLHDCNPEKEEHTIVPRPKPTGHWNGDVYKFAGRLSSFEFFHTVDIDNGCGVFMNVDGGIFPIRHEFDWQYFDKNRKELLNLISWEDFIK